MQGGRTLYMQVITMQGGRTLYMQVITMQGCRTLYLQGAVGDRIIIYVGNYYTYIHTYIHTLLGSSRRLFNTNLYGMVIKKQG